MTTVPSPNTSVSIEKRGLAGLESAEPGRGVVGVLRRLVWKHRVALRFLDEPRRARKSVGVGRMIVMIVGEGQVGDIGRLVADFRQLAPQRLVDRCPSLGSSSRLNEIVRDDSRLPKERSSRV